MAVAAEFERCNRAGEACPQLKLSGLRMDDEDRAVFPSHCEQVVVRVRRKLQDGTANA